MEGQGLLATRCVLRFTWKDAASSALRLWWHSLSRDPKAKVHVQRAVAGYLPVFCKSNDSEGKSPTHGRCPCDWHPPSPYTHKRLEAATCPPH